MQILEGKDVDVISPFPVSMLAAAAQWARCYKSVVIDDHGPQTNEAIAEHLRGRFALPTTRTYAIVDKNNLTRTHEYETPIVGVISVESNNPENAYVHVLSHRRAWGEKLAQPGLIEQGARIVLTHIFPAMPELERLNAAILEANHPAKNFIMRIGFKRDGRFANAVRVGGKMQGLVHYGFLRPHVQVGE